MRRFAALLLLVALAACAPDSAPTEVAAAVAPNRILSAWQTVNDAPNSLYSAQPWQFIAQENDAIHLRLDSQSAGSTLTLQAPDGAVIGRGNDLRVTLLQAGIYSAVVHFTPGDIAPYALTFEYTDRVDPSKPTPTPTHTPTMTPSPTPTITPTPTPVYAMLGTLEGPLTSGMPRNNTFSSATERHVYLFTSDAGVFANIRMARLSGSIDPFLTLYDPQGNPVASDDNTGGDASAYLQNIRLPISGEYSLRASGDGPQGEYRIGITLSTQREPVMPVIPEPTPTITPSPTPEPRNDRLLDHVPVTGRIARPGDFVRYPIVALAGEIFTVGVSPVAGSAVRPKVELYNPQGELVRSANVRTSNADGDAIIPVFQAAESGTYIALVEAETEDTGDFVISYGLGASREDVARGDAAADAEMGGELPRPGLRDVWTIHLNRDDVISVSVSPQASGFDPALELIAPDGSPLAFDDNSGGGLVPVLNSVRATMNGPYQVRVTGSNAASAGPYTLVWHYVVVAPTATPPAAAILIMSVDDVVPDRVYLDYPFQGFAGQRIVMRVTAKPNSGLDPVAALLTADGTVLARADDNGTDLNPILEYVLPTDGTYFARVDGYQSSGGFDLTIEALY